MTELHESQRRFQPIARYVAPTSLDHALEELASAGSAARAVAGGTDLLLELSRGARQGVNTLVDLSVLHGLNTITAHNGRVELGPLVTHGDVVADPLLTEAALPLAQACLEVGGPQLRNRATVVGNIVTASPANDTLSVLYALDAQVTVVSLSGERTMPISQFVTGFRTTALQPHELVTKISFDRLGGRRRGVFVKLGLRRAQAISVVHACVVVQTDPDGAVTDLVVALGSVGPTIVIAEAAAQVAMGRSLTDESLPAEVGAAARRSVSPIDDVRSTAQYRSHATAVVVERAIRALAAGTEAATWPAHPPRLMAAGGASSGGAAQQSTLAGHVTDADEVTVTVNGQTRSAANAAGRTLLDWLRFDLGLTGTKEGCAEGECGACTVHLNGKAVLACLVPAARVAGASLTTIEGIAPAGTSPAGTTPTVTDGTASSGATSDAGTGEGASLHPVQRALADCGGVQCGFCTPGFVMSAVMLARECPQPSRAQAELALSGNLCRCTGYYSIIEAVTGGLADSTGPATPSSRVVAP